MLSYCGLGMVPRMKRGGFKAFSSTKVKNALVDAKKPCAYDKPVGKVLYYPICYVMYTIVWYENDRYSSGT